jgi:hypothetical protein
MKQDKLREPHVHFVSCFYNGIFSKLEECRIFTRDKDIRHEKSEKLLSKQRTRNFVFMVATGTNIFILFLSFFFAILLYARKKIMGKYRMYPSLDYLSLLLRN